MTEFHQDPLFDAEALKPDVTVMGRTGLDGLVVLVHAPEAENYQEHQGGNYYKPGYNQHHDALEEDERRAIQATLQEAEGEDL